MRIRFSGSVSPEPVRGCKRESHLLRWGRCYWTAAGSIHTASQWWPSGSKKVR